LTFLSLSLSLSQTRGGGGGGALFLGARENVRAGESVLRIAGTGKKKGTRRRSARALL